MAIEVGVCYSLKESRINETMDESDFVNHQGHHEPMTRLLRDREPARRHCSVFCMQILFMIFYAIFCPLHFFCLGIIAAFDTLCLVKQGRSVINCTEKVILTKPQPLVIVFFLTSIINAIVVLTTLYLKPAGIKFRGFRFAARKLVKKGAFWSFNVTFVCVIVEYIMVSFKNFSATSKTLAILMIFFMSSRLVVVYSINYLPPVKFPKPEERDCARVFIWFGYWITLVMLFLDTSHVAMAVTLDVAERVAPVGDIKLGSHDFGVVIHLVLFGIKATFEARLFLFYWNKVFHGDKDFFSTAVVLKSIKDEFHNRTLRPEQMAQSGSERENSAPNAKLAVHLENP